MSKVLSIFLATSGHSGVDRVFRNLIPCFSKNFKHVHLLTIKNHGPDYGSICYKNVTHVEFPTKHTYLALLFLIRHIIEVKPDIIFSDKDKVNRVSLLASILSNNKPEIFFRLGTTVSVNLSSRNFLQKIIQEKSISYLYRYASSIIVPSEGVRDDLFLSYKLKNVSVAHSPVLNDLLYSQASEAVTHPWFSEQNIPIVIGVGELSARKDFSTLIKAHAIALKKIKIRLVIIGDGAQRDHLLRLSKEIGSADHVDLIGHVKNPYMYMAKSSLFVLTSQWEGMPVVLLEALSLGIPSISSNCPSGPFEVLRGGQIGPLFPVGDFNLLANLMIKQLETKVDKQKLIDSVSSYNSENACASYMKILDPTITSN
jgi:glycosyltransferase involved in cell wall biosynthesis